VKIKKKNNEMPEDTVKDNEDRIQDLTNKFCKDIDGITAAKEKEIMEV
jgi:ribosome recycling factor